MLSPFKTLPVLLLLSPALGCLHFNATLDGKHLSVYSWDDSNNNNATNPEDIICQGHNLQPTSHNQWTVPCARVDHAESHSAFDIYLDRSFERFVDIIYRYTNPEAAGLQAGDKNPDEFVFNFRVGSVDGKFWKSREFCAQYDILRLIKPEALKNPCDSLDTC